MNNSHFPQTSFKLSVCFAAALLAACGGGGEEPEASAAVEATAFESQGRMQALAVSLPALRPAPANTSGNLVCNNLRVGAIVVDNVEVPSGMTCRLAGTQVRGSVQVAPGGILVANAVQVAGNVQGDAARHVEVTGTSTRISGGVELEGGGSATLSGVQVAGDVFVNGLSDVVVLRSNRVGGNLQVQDGLGGGEVAGNRVTGNLQCSGNLPAPLASNNTAASIEDQCLPNGGITPPPPPLSGNVTCVGLTIGAVRLDSVSVPAGATCTLLGTTMNGSVEVGAGARLTAENINVTGNLLADGASALRLTGNSLIGGSLQLQRGGDSVVAGAAITGDLQIDAMAGAVSASNNRVTGSLQAMANRGGLALTGNRMGGVMQCKDNLPAPTGSGNVASLKEDQCRGL